MLKMNNAADRRKYPRLTAYHLVKYNIVSREEQGEKVIASLKDIGGGGICLLTKENIPLDTVIQVYIHFPGIDPPIPCLAKVTWTRYLETTKAYRIGAKFIEIEELFRSQIIRHIDRVRDMAKKGETKLMSKLPKFLVLIALLCAVAALTARFNIGVFPSYLRAFAWLKLSGLLLLFSIAISVLPEDK